MVRSNWSMTLVLVGLQDVLGTFMLFRAVDTGDTRLCFWPETPGAGVGHRRHQTDLWSRLQEELDQEGARGGAPGSGGGALRRGGVGGARGAGGGHRRHGALLLNRAPGGGGGAGTVKGVGLWPKVSRPRHGAIHGPVDYIADFQFDSSKNNFLIETIDFVFLLTFVPLWLIDDCFFCS